MGRVAQFGIGQGKKTARDEMNRLDLQASLNGYWAFGSRLMTRLAPAGTDESV
ncbi:MAG: hypothetical protein ACLSAH_06070 [Bilophila wadsworthia]